jgi:VWFA-related protein
MRRLAIVAAGVALNSMLGVAQQPNPSFTASSDLVVVPTVVVDRKGELIRGLTVESFQLFEDGKRQPVETFVPPDTEGAGADGRFIVLVLDNLRTPTELAARVQNIARRFASRMGPSDMVSAITLDRGRSSMARTPEELRAAIDRFRPAFGDTIRRDADDIEHGLQMIGSLAGQLSEVPHRRKVLVFIGAASMFSPSDESAFFDRAPELNERWFDAIHRTGQDNVSVYVIDPQGFTGGVDNYSEGFTEQTGGRAWVNASDFNRAVDQIWQESGGYYLLGYRAPINDRRLHKIEVKTNAPGATVRARRVRG